jgi:hypothetical protein
VQVDARDVDGALAVTDETSTGRTMEGGSVYGRDAVRAYWTRQWTVIDPNVDPVRFTTDADGDIVVVVHQLVRDLDGNRARGPDGAARLYRRRRQGPQDANSVTSTTVAGASGARYVIGERRAVTRTAASQCS